MKISSSKTKMAKRLQSLLLILAMIVTMLPFLNLTASAGANVHPVGNASLEAAINNKLTTLQQADHSQVWILDLSGQNICGYVDVALLETHFPNLGFLDLSNNNITGIGAGTIPPILTDTFVDPNSGSKRSFELTGGYAVCSEATSYPNLPVSDLLAVIRIKTAGGNIAVPPAILDSGTVEISGTVNGAPYAATYNSVNPTGDVGNIASFPAGVYEVSLDFPIKDSAGASLKTKVPLQIKTSSYVLTPAASTLYDGGNAVDFTFTVTGKDGNPVFISSVSDYYVQLYIDALTSTTITNRKINADGTMTITVASSDIVGGSTSVDLQVFDAPYVVGSTPRAQAKVTLLRNPVLRDIRLIEQNTGKPIPDDPLDNIYVYSTNTLYIYGGTTVSSVDENNLIKPNDPYSTTTIYYLLGETVGGYWPYIPAHYKSQIEIKIGEDSGGKPCELAAELISVPHPGGDSEQVLALVVTAKTSDPKKYETTSAATQPITLTLKNYNSTSAVMYLNANILSSEAKGIIIYKIPSVYEKYTKAQIEAAIASGTDKRIEVVSQYEVVNGNWDEIIVSRATIVENSTIYLVAAAYYEAGGQVFIVPDSMINGWYDGPWSMGMFFGASLSSISEYPYSSSSTSMKARLAPASVVFSADTVVLEVQTDGYRQTVNPEKDGQVIFAPESAKMNVGLPITKIGKEIIEYVISDAPYVPVLGGADVYKELLLQINAVNAMPAGTYVPGPYRLYDLNELRKDDIAIGGKKTYEIWTIYSNYEVSQTYTTSVAGGVGMVPSGSVTPEAIAGNNALFNAVCTSDGGPADKLLIGSKVDMTYKNGAISAPTVELTIKGSEVNGLHLVFEDLLSGTLYSADEELYGNSNFNIKQLTNNFQIPQGMTARVYAVFSYGNSTFFKDMSGAAGTDEDWRTYIVPAADVALTITPASPANLTEGAPSTDYRVLNGNVVSSNNGVLAAWTGSGSGAINSGIPDLVDVILPTAVGIRAEDPFALGSYVTSGSTLSQPFIVGQKWDTNPQIRLSSGADIDAYVTAGYTGDIKVVVDPAADSNGVNNVVVDPAGSGKIYEIGFWNPVTGLVVKYEYTYTVNGVTFVLELPAPASSPSVPYTARLNVGYPEIEGIYLVASDPSSGKLKWWGNGGIVPGSVNEYTLPYASNSTVKLYPVIMNSRVNLDPNFTVPDALGMVWQDLENDADPYFSLQKVSDTGSVGQWTAAASSYFVGSPKIASGTNRIYYEVRFTGQVTEPNYLDFIFDANPTSPAVNFPTGSYSKFSAAALAAVSYKDTLQLFHLPDADSAYIVDISAKDSIQPAPMYQVNVPVLFDIKYYLSSSVAAGVNKFEVPVTYFDTDTNSMMPNPPQGSLPYNKGLHNALLVEVFSTPTGSDSDVRFTSVPSLSQLSFVATVPGTYVFRLTTVNNAGVLTPNYPPRYEELKFTVTSPQVPDDIYWMQVKPIKSAALPAGWASIEEVVASGASRVLDADALTAGYLKMLNNRDDLAVVKVKDATGTEISTLVVSAYRADPVSAKLNHTTSGSSPLVVAPGSSTPLFWEVTYGPVTGSLAPYVINETILNSASTWQQLSSQAGAAMNLAGGYVTANASGGVVVYQAVYTKTATPTTEQFWAKIDTQLPTPSYSYEIRDGATAVSTATAVGTIPLMQGDVKTFNVRDMSAQGALTDISLVDNDNTLYTHAFIASGTGEFTVYALKEGKSTITVYPKAGGSIDIIIEVSVPDYTVTYNANGGGSAPAAATVPSGTSITLAGGTGMTAPAGQEFNGWNTAASGGGTAYPAGTLFTVRANTTLYAQWVPTGTSNTVTLTYHVNDGGGTAPTDPNSPYTPGSSVVVLNATASMTPPAQNPHYVFANWNTVPDGSGTAYGASVSFNIAVNTILYAQWVDPNVTYAVTYNANGGSGSVPTDNNRYALNASVPVASGSGMTPPTGQVFVSWNTAANGGGTTYNAGTSFNITANTTLYAQWQRTGGSDNSGGGGGGGGGGSSSDGSAATTYNIKIDAGSGGTASANMVTSIAGAKVTITVKPAKGYAVKSVAVKDDKNDSSVPVSKDSATKYSFVMPAGGVTVTVIFEATAEGPDDGGPDIGPDGPDKPDGPGGEHICPSLPYADVDQTMWYHEFIDFVIANKIMQGTSTDPLMFEPNTKLSRAMMVQILYNIEGKPAVDSDQIFGDVPPGSWFFDAIAWSYEFEVVFGYGDGNFGPNDPVTREQMVAILYRYAQYKGYDVSASADLGAFEDAGDVSSWAVPAMKWAIATGLIVGRDATHIVPKDNATRAEVATIITRVCKAILSGAPTVPAGDDEDADDSEIEDEAGETESENGEDEGSETGDKDETDNSEAAVG